ncbi:hypothetical protein NSK_001769 [Nannochloropsis salina CCMP1776]|jgi:MFS superfamily sulfate permease-like transporter/CRP-like cAMP-binding protein|uniref:Cyclic nucleotide-binding domain-containing protein n=1 Tax=Nannochloropsis salina CCMP1776 TaxID=1027361 RepID=A0A4D9DFC2_9STRA|nr:hypothetical protein NSK_001769 [Nannochloropsis salina CCMP1776]|eukprot:TFJ87438.1 hypothetical protein NSK_001769 [Nannochloropsis salina CCMP1776]
MPMLAKLFILSSVVHQAIFSLFSTLPYAVGQIQDAGLIFLSKIATSVVFLLKDKPAEVVVSTALVTLGLSTAVLGATLMALGHYKLARLVSYLPLPVIGGQIVFIAAFCFRAGVALSVGHDLDSLQAWSALYDPRAVVLVLPGILAGVVLSIVAHSFKHFLALPVAMVCVPLVFYGVLFLAGESMEGARDFGWVGPANAPASWQASVALYQVWPPDLLGRIEWWVVPYQLPTLLGMIFVVSFSSCLDIVAIEMDGGRPLNKNHELSTVGASNLIAGLCGGFTGSYIFSQTIFTYRTQTRSRLCGLVLIVAELAVFFCDVDLMSYIPLYFFAATLHFITFELMLEWLVEARLRMTAKEYVVLWTTFLGNVAFGIIPGFALGIVLSMAMFIVSYAKSTARTAQAQRQRSRVARLRGARRLLDHGKILTLELNGAIFFGSSITTLEHIKSLLGVAQSPSRKAKERSTERGKGKMVGAGEYRPSRTHSRRSLTEEAEMWAGGQSTGSGGAHTKAAGRRVSSNALTGRRKKTFRNLSSSLWTRVWHGGSVDAPKEAQKAAVDEEEATEASPLVGQTSAASLALLGSSLPPSSPPSHEGRSIGGGASAVTGTYGTGMKPFSEAMTQEMQASGTGAAHHFANAPKPRFLILDFRRVPAIDMSSVVNCFLPLQTLCKDVQVILCYSNCNVRVEFYLRANRLLADNNTRLFPTLHQALDSCETALLAEESQHTHGHSLRARAFSLRGMQELSVVSVLRKLLLEEEEEDGEGQEIGSAMASSVDEDALEMIAHYAREETFREEDSIFYKDDISDSFYLILSGEVALESLEEDAREEPVRAADRLPPWGDGSRDWRRRRVEVVLHSGSLFGFVDFFLENQRRRFFARAMTPVKLGVFSQTALRRLEEEHPRLMVLVQKLLLKQFSIELGNVSVL